MGSFINNFYIDSQQQIDEKNFCDFFLVNANQFSGRETAY